MVQAARFMELANKIIKKANNQCPFCKKRAKNDCVEPNGKDES